MESARTAKSRGVSPWAEAVSCKEQRPGSLYGVKGLQGLEVRVTRVFNATRKSLWDQSYDAMWSHFLHVHI